MLASELVMALQDAISAHGDHPVTLDTPDPAGVQHGPEIEDVIKNPNDFSQPFVLYVAGTPVMLDRNWMSARQSRWMTDSELAMEYGD